MRLIPLFALPKALLPEVGGKARGLYLLHKAGLPVADGFVLYDLQTALDKTIAADHYVWSGMEAVAVRSSAKGEDGVEFSSAGQYATVLNVRNRAAFFDAVETCLRSVDSDRARHYAEDFLGAERSPMTVVVQKMVQSEKSGVCFTSDPMDDGKTMRIEAVSGLGEGLVSGKQSAQRYTVPKGELSAISVPEDSLLTASELTEIAKGAQLAREKLGRELDLEWAIDKDGKLWYLQARPITTTDCATIHELDCKRDLTDHVLTTCNIGEMLPGVVTPLSLSTSVNGIDWGMRKMLVDVGVYPSLDRIPPSACVLSIGNTLFIDLTTLYSMGKRIVMANKEGIELSICGRVLGEAPDTDFPTASMATKLSNGKRYGKYLLSVKKQKARLEELVQEAKILPVDDPVEYYRRISEKLPLMDEALYCHYAACSFSGAMNSALYMTLEKHEPDKLALKAKIAGVLENIDDIESVDILRSLRKIAQAVLSRNPEAKSWTTEELSAYIHHDGGEAKYDYQKFLRRHGHRAIREAELRSKAWKDDERALMEYLRVVIASGAKESDIDREQWRQNQEELLSAVRPSARKGLETLICQARKGVREREETKSLIIKVIDPFKQAYRDLSSLLVERNLLVDQDCIFFLTHEEIGRLIDGETALNKKALSRRRLMPEQKQLSYPEISIGRPEPVTVKPEPSGTVFQGVPVSRGIAVGRARVVRSMEDAGKLQKGEIMVAPFTDIGWSPYYCMINGLVTEVGSALSHGAVVAREYALPLVVDLPGITSQIHTGDYVCVNGTTGQVELLDEQEAKLRMAQ
ncbi:MAG: PEP/pyruvate-binding domain-containing protein [Oscillospiraceae bacterium]|nr:PEP/pyruvate-binding domain-containing protein [Oscillospiraceae bacterium]